MYGRESDLIGRPALHSAYLYLTQPITGRRIEVAAPLPEDMNSLHNFNFIKL